MAVFAQFGTNWGFKSVPRPETVFTLQCAEELDKEGPHLGVRPVLLHRVSPLADERMHRPLPEDDVMPARSGGFLVDEAAPALLALPSRFTQAEWTTDTAWTEAFPDQLVASLGMEATAVGLHGANAFLGDLSKAVDQEQRALTEDKASVIRENHMKEVKKGQSSGPTPTVLSAAARITPEGVVKKDLYDEESVRWRSTSDSSALNTGYDFGSVNDLTWTPKLRILSSHLSAAQIRDTLALQFATLGPGVTRGASWRMQPIYQRVSG
jgi:hypothetical protein